MGANRAQVSCTRLPSEKSTLSKSTWPASILEKSRMSLTRSSNVRVEWVSFFNHSCCSPFRELTSNRYASPSTAVMGVRIS